MNNHCLLEDLFEHASLIDPYFSGLKLVKYTKRTHEISGWYGIAGMYGDGRKEVKFDVWCGFDNKYFDSINYQLFLFCQRVGIQHL